MTRLAALALGVPLLALALIACDNGDAPAPAGPSPEVGAAETLGLANDGALAPYLTDGDGRTLYIFTQDSPGMSNCTGSCADLWPPLTVAAGEEPAVADGLPGEVAVIERADGARQVTYDGAPLYTYAADSGPGDTSGHEVGGVWFVATPEGAVAGASSGVAPSGGDSPASDDYSY